LFTLRGDSESAESECGMEIARSIIAADVETDVLFREFFEQTLVVEEQFRGRLKVWYDLTSLGRALERIGDLCMNIAEDAIFMFSGEIVRHHLPGIPAEHSSVLDE
jgi:phosphate uptake regulator